jgi:hypothetical protein
MISNGEKTRPDRPERQVREKSDEEMTRKTGTKIIDKMWLEYRIFKRSPAFAHLLKELV